MVLLLLRLLLTMGRLRNAHRLNLLLRLARLTRRAASPFVARRRGSLQPLGLGGQLVVLGGKQVVHVADGLEEDVEAGLVLDVPEDGAVLEPGVGEDAVEAAEDVDEVLDGDALAVGVGRDDEAAGEDLGVGDDVGGPVEGVAAVVDGAAALGLLVHGAEELPLRRAHFRTRIGAAGRRVEQEADDEGVALRDEEAAEFVEPEGSVDGWRRGGELDGGGATNRLGVALGVVEMEGSEMLLELECRIEL